MLIVFYLLIQNGDVYTAAELPCKQIAKSEEDLLDVYVCDLFETVMSRMQCIVVNCSC